MLEVIETSRLTLGAMTGVKALFLLVARFSDLKSVRKRHPDKMRV